MWAASDGPPSIASSGQESSDCRELWPRCRGPAAFLAYLLCAVLIGLIGLCFAEAGSRVAGGGGLYAYATESFGPVVGGIAGTLLWVANSVVAAAAVANLLLDTLTSTIPVAGAGASRFVLLAVLYIVLATVNIRGARPGARLSVILAVVKIAPLAPLIVAGAFSCAGRTCIGFRYRPHRRLARPLSCCSSHSWESKVH